MNHQDMAFELVDFIANVNGVYANSSSVNIAQTGTAYVALDVDVEAEYTDGITIKVRIADHGDAYGNADIDVSNGADASVYVDFEAGFDLNERLGKIVEQALKIGANYDE